MTMSGKTNESEREQVKLNDFRFHNETKDQSGSGRILLNFFCNK